MPSPSKNQSRTKAFSLIEVVIAVGIFAISIVAVIGLLGPTNKSVADVRDTDDATRVVGAVQAALQNIAQKSTGFTTLGGYLQATAPADPADGTAYPNAALTFYANRDASLIAPGNDNSAPPIFPDNTQKYFEITLIRNTDLSPNSGANLDATAGFLAYTIRLRWPAYNPDGTEFTAHSQKNVLLVPGAVHR